MAAMHWIECMFLTLNRCALHLNMLSCLEHVFDAEPLHTSSKHALAALECVDGLEYLGGVARDLDLAPNLGNPALGVDQKC